MCFFLMILNAVKEVGDETEQHIEVGGPEGCSSIQVSRAQESGEEEPSRSQENGISPPTWSQLDVCFENEMDPVDIRTPPPKVP